MANHDVLLHTTHLSAGSVVGIAHLTDTIAREITLGGARIADGHSEVTLFITLHAHLCPALRVVRNVVLRISSRTIGLRVGIDAEHGEVAGLARPHPVIGLTAELTHRLGHGEHQTNVGEVLIGRCIEAVALIEGFYFQTQRAILCLHVLGHRVFQRVDEHFLLVDGHLLEAELHHLVGDVLLLNHERNEHVGIGQFLFVRIGDEAIEHVVVLHGGVGADSFEAAVVVGEHQAVGRDDDARAVTREVYAGSLQRRRTVVEVVVRHLEAFCLHLLIDSLRQVVNGPHALVGMCGAHA